MSEAAKGRRWFRFSLRTLFVAVSVVACWLGWQAKTVRDRFTVRRVIEASGAQIVPGALHGKSTRVVRPGEPFARLPWARSVMGDEPVGMIFFPRELSPTDLANVDYFPEACVLQNATFTPTPNR